MSESNASRRISPTALYTGAVWVRNGLAPKGFATLPGRLLHAAVGPAMHAVRAATGISDLDACLLQRHVVIDHLLERAMEEQGVGQVLEIAAGLSARGARFSRNHQDRGLVYVEADLPHMARRKRALLARTGSHGMRHLVVACDVLAGAGPASLEAVAARHLAPGVPTAVITEGLIYYFPPEVVARMWERIAALLARQGGGVYLADGMCGKWTDPAYALALAWNRVIGVFARGRLYSHFGSHRAAAAGLAARGFAQAVCHAPEDFAHLPGLPLSRRPSFLYVLEGRVGAGGA